MRNGNTMIIQNRSHHAPSFCFSLFPIRTNGILYFLSTPIAPDRLIPRRQETDGKGPTLGVTGAHMTPMLPFECKTDTGRKKHSDRKEGGIGRSQVNSALLSMHPYPCREK